jgi:hypothetical protein
VNTVWGGGDGAPNTATHLSTLIFKFISSNHKLEIVIKTLADGEAGISEQSPTPPPKEREPANNACSGT